MTNFFQSVVGLPFEWAWFVATIVGILVIALPLMLAVAMIIYADRKIWAAMALRRGPNVVGPFGLLQSFADGLKVFLQETIIPTSANKTLFLLAPIITFTVALIVWAVIPFQAGVVLADINVGLLYVLAASSLGVYGIILAGWSSNSKYPFYSAIRASAQMISYEIPLVLSAVIVVMMVGSLDAAEIAGEQKGGNWFVFYPWGFAAFVIFFIAALAETNRSPFDLPEAESEIIAGYFTEYSGFKFALFFLAEYIAMFAISGLAVTLFLGGGDGPGLAVLPWLSVIWFLAKIFALIAVMIWLRGTLPRLRVDQLMGFAWKFMLPLSILNIFVAGFAWHAKQLDSQFIMVITWVISLAVLYGAASGLNQLNRGKVRPREYKYAE